jgi:hypothetical protein
MIYRLNQPNLWNDKFVDEVLLGDICDDDFGCAFAGCF